ncbi:MAG: hypothetical protein DRJ98_02445, partial [Thermoprotei archaeon]
EVLAKEGWVKDVKLTDGKHLSIYVEKGEGKVPKVVKLAEQMAIEVEAVSLRRPTLEDVFIHLTGKVPLEERAERQGKPWRH